MSEFGVKEFRVQASCSPEVERPEHPLALLGGSWVVISGVIIRVTIVITHIRGLITLLLHPKP